MHGNWIDGRKSQGLACLKIEETPVLPALQGTLVDIYLTIGQ
tara:strand:- start:1352 stop:1477 length:126 start_codon:yes stop_codon:yes gene_type:complete